MPGFWWCCRRPKSALGIKALRRPGVEEPPLPQTWATERKGAPEGVVMGQGVPPGRRGGDEDRSHGAGSWAAWEGVGAVAEASPGWGQWPRRVEWEDSLGRLSLVLEQASLHSAHLGFETEFSLRPCPVCLSIRNFALWQTAVTGGI